jgi:phosphoenolpyruvate---glycerone phosphotransferase subunit DhaL
MSEIIRASQITEAIQKASQALIDESENLTTLDQAMGDGDMGITMAKIGHALQEYMANNPVGDIGKFLGGAGMAANRAAPSTMGTLLATALMRAGKVVMGKNELELKDIASMLQAAEAGVQERGKAQLGNKTILDALDPAVAAFGKVVDEGGSLTEAGKEALSAAQQGRDQVTPLRSQVGRASWVGERTIGKIDPGCEALVVILNALNA